MVILHIWALHIPGSSNPTGVDVKGEKDTSVPPVLHGQGRLVAAAFLILFALVVYFAPNFLGHPDNYIPANPLATPAHIVPEWYFWPFYAILRAFTVDFILPAKLWGVLAMFASILLLFFLPWLDRSPVRSGIYRPMFKFFWLLIAGIAVLGWCGGAAAKPSTSWSARSHRPIISRTSWSSCRSSRRSRRPLPLPYSITEAVHGEKQEAAPVGNAHAARRNGDRRIRGHEQCSFIFWALVGARLRRWCC